MRYSGKGIDPLANPGTAVGKWNSRAFQSVSNQVNKWNKEGSNLDTSTGGSEIYTSGGYRIHRFNPNTTQTFTASTLKPEYPVEALIIAGGGNHAGVGHGYAGGGAGGYIYLSSVNLTSRDNSIVSGTNRANSQAFGYNVVRGGNAGGDYGGSGGGGNRGGGGGGGNEPGQGHYGGNGGGGHGHWHGGGGGGAGNHGNGTNGGNGLANSISGSSYTYSGGGAGGNSENGGWGSNGSHSGYGSWNNEGVVYIRYPLDNASF